MALAIWLTSVSDKFGTSGGRPEAMAKNSRFYVEFEDVSEAGGAHKQVPDPPGFLEHISREGVSWVVHFDGPGCQLQATRWYRMWRRGRCSSYCLFVECAENCCTIDLRGDG